MTILIKQSLHCRMYTLAIVQGWVLYSNFYANELQMLGRQSDGLQHCLISSYQQSNT